MAGPYDLFINQGEDFEQFFQWQLADCEPVNLTGYAAKCQLRIDAQNTNVVAEVNVKITDAINGRFSLSMTSQQTAAIPTDGVSYRDTKRYVYDVKMSSASGIVYRVINGYANVSPEVTK